MMKEFELKQLGKIKRLTNKTFKFDERVKEGWFSAVYFLKTTEIIEKYKKESKVTMQFFQRKNNVVVCGMDESIALLHSFARNPESLEIYALHDGDMVNAYEVVLTITGNYADFGFLEGLIDGILARRSSVATNVHRVVKAAEPKIVLFMGDRNDHFNQQAGDGYAAFIGGSSAQATHAMNEWWGKEGVGTMPHALIQLFDGDIVAASRAYLETFPEDRLVVLVDYHNNVIEDSLKVARALGDKLSSVRIDTSGNMVDQYFMRNPQLLGRFDPRGCNKELVIALREALNKEGFQHVKIIVSGGLNPEKIIQFEKENVPIDMYGVGSSLLEITVGFTGDNVLLDGEPQAKAGRQYWPNSKLQKVEYEFS